MTTPEPDPHGATPAPAVARSVQATVLVIDDDPHIRHAVRIALRMTVTEVVDAATAAEAMRLVMQRRPDLVILDLGLPDRSGGELCAMIRAHTPAPILVLTARHIEADKVALLNAGADDYVTKPFGTLELAARVSAQLRRARTLRHPPATSVTIDGLVIDLEERTVRRDGMVIRLTPIEWGLLQALVSSQGRLYTHQQLFDSVWGRPYGDVRQYLRVHVTNLRRKIERDPANPRVVITEPGVGYRLGEP